MKKFAVTVATGLSVLIFIIAGCATTDTAGVVTAESPDQAAIRAFFAGFEKAWNDKDPEAYKSYWTTDGILVDRRGNENFVRKESNRSLKRRMEKETNKYKVTKITLTGDKASVLAEFTSTYGELDLQFDLVRQDGNWKIKKRDLQ